MAKAMGEARIQSRQQASEKVVPPVLTDGSITDASDTVLVPVMGDGVVVIPS